MQNSILNPKVLVRCMTYNHEKYIEDALNGFIMQKTDFPFIVAVVDDASTDNNVKVINEFISKNCNKIKNYIEEDKEYGKVIQSQVTNNPNCHFYVVLLNKNHYSDPNKRALRHFYYRFIEDQAKYIAMCEGDDYWTDPYKLQKQVDYMESHPECAVCFHPVMVHDQRTGEEYPDTLTKVPQITTIHDLARLNNYMHSPSIMYRYNAEVHRTMEQFGKIGVGDYLMSMLYAENGNICKLPDYMAVYRQGVGVWTGPNSDGEKNMFIWIVAISKLSSVLQDPEAKRLIDEQIDSMVGELLSYHHDTEKQLLQIRSSKAYRLGKLLLMPFRWMKRKK